MSIKMKNNLFSQEKNDITSMWSLYGRTLYAYRRIILELTKAFLEGLRIIRYVVLSCANAVTERH